MNDSRIKFHCVYNDWTALFTLFLLWLSIADYKVWNCILLITVLLPVFAHISFIWIWMDSYFIWKYIVSPSCYTYLSCLFFKLSYNILHEVNGYQITYQSNIRITFTAFTLDFITNSKTISMFTGLVNFLLLHQWINH